MSRIRREPADRRLHRYFVRLMLLLMLAEWLLLALERSWLPLFLVTLIILTLLAPIIFWRRLQVDLPAEFHLLAVVFIFASFYLGEIHDFYARFWWWDIALHASAGFLMGILGFLLVYLLNESRRVELHMTPGFLAFFAFIFAVAIGSLWEIFEFAMDQLVGTQMQKPMLGDPSGLTDTMWDMIVNAFGALLISLAGYAYLKRGSNFFVKRWIRAFIERNPDMFTR